MRTFLIIPLLFSGHTLLAQTNWRDTTNGIPLHFSDTCFKIKERSYENLVVKSRHSEPLYIANGIVVRADALSKNIDLIKNISVLKCPEAFNMFGYIGLNGIIQIATKQSFKVITPNAIRKNNYREIKDRIIYALNGDIITDSLLKISTKSIRKIELLKSGTEKGNNIKYKNLACINIWTLTESERMPMSGLCRGLRITQQ